MSRSFDFLNLMLTLQCTILCSEICSSFLQDSSRLVAKENIVQQHATVPTSISMKNSRSIVEHRSIFI